MEIAFQDWAGLLVRWLHLAAGIAWIGSSFYFIWLDLSLDKRDDLPKGVLGESWSVHGGGFYHVRKYMVAPEKMPTELHWFKYESYFTWLSGFALLAVMYYWGAESYLISSDVMELTPLQGIAMSLAFLALGWVVYDLICRSPLGNNTLVLALCVFVLVVGAAWGLSNVFSGRAAFLHVGAMIGTIMTGNVFFIIIPNQKKVVAELIAGRVPEAALGIQAKQRSTHNNYLTLPVLLMMVSNHYPMLYAQSRTWLVVALIVLAGGITRHFFNTRHAGGRGLATAWQWPVAGVLIVVLAAIVSMRDDAGRAGGEVISAGEALAIVQTRCVSCHGVRPIDEDFAEAPGGVLLERLEDLRKYAPRVMAQSVLSDSMPLANKTAMTKDERAALGLWIRSGMPEE